MDVLDIIGYVIVILILVWAFRRVLTFRDGFTSAGGEVGTSKDYVDALQSMVTSLKDELLVSKYRKNYEQAVIQLDDYVNLLMVKQSLHVPINLNDEAGALEVFDKLNKLYQTKQSLDITMKVLNEMDT